MEEPSLEGLADERRGGVGTYSPVDPGVLLGETLDGGWVFAARHWRAGARVFELVSARSRPLSPRARQVVALVSRGASNDEARHVLGLAESTVCEQLRATAERLRAHPLDLVALGPLFDWVERRAPRVVLRRGAHALLVYPTPTAIPGELTPSELAVARLVADGASNVEIARARRTSVNTVANQIAALYRKLRARSRRECARTLYGCERACIDARALAVLDRIPCAAGRDSSSDSLPTVPPPKL